MSSVPALLLLLLAGLPALADEVGTEASEEYFPFHPPGWDWGRTHSRFATKYTGGSHSPSNTVPVVTVTKHVPAAQDSMASAPPPSTTDTCMALMQNSFQPAQIAVFCPGWYAEGSQHAVYPAYASACGPDPTSRISSACTALGYPSTSVATAAAPATTTPPTATGLSAGDSCKQLFASESAELGLFCPAWYKGGNTQARRSPSWVAPAYQSACSGNSYSRISSVCTAYGYPNTMAVSCSPTTVTEPAQTVSGPTIVRFETVTATGPTVTTTATAPTVTVTVTVTTTATTTAPPVTTTVQGPTITAPPVTVSDLIMPTQVTANQDGRKPGWADLNPFGGGSGPFATRGGYGWNKPGRDGDRG